MQNTQPQNWLTLLKHPSAFLPIALSGLALMVIIVHLVRFGVAREPDERAAAHIWQLLMAIQVPVIVFFVVKWVREAATAILPVLALQVLAACLAAAPVYLLHL